MATSEQRPAPGLTETVQANLRAMIEHRARLARAESIHDRIADRIARWAGSMYFAYAHAVLFGAWIAWNAIPSLPHWDPYPYVMLAMFASVEAIFLSTFVLVSQNRMAVLADRRAELDVQINLLSEREITRVLVLCARIAEKLDVRDQPADLADLQSDIDPGEILDTLDKAQREAEHPTRPAPREPSPGGRRRAR